jgi:asparagine synthase (glutamine-hydrolysing)
MCGISGVIGSQSITPRNQERLQRVHRGLAHRGPNGSAITTKRGQIDIAFGHHRLAIQDLSAKSDQPIKSPSGALLAFNGEIYNCKDLKILIGDKWNFQTTGDTEVLLAVLELFGIAGLAKVEGIFAFAFANSSGSEILLGRDRIGIKPLYWAREDSQIWFSSESKSLGEALNTGLDKHAFHEWAIFQFPVTHRTFYNGVSAVAPGHVISIRESGIKEKKYWNLPDFLPSNSLKADNRDLADKLRSILELSVSAQMVSDVPVASFNSGGMDSSSVTSIAAKFGLAESFIGTYSSDGYSEYQYAKLVADNAKVPLTEVKIESRDFFDALPKVISSLDFPIAGPGAVGQYLVSQKASEKYRVMLSGSGGDELFLGYTRDRFPLIAAGIINATEGYPPLDDVWSALTGDLRSLSGYDPMHKVFSQNQGYTHPLDGFIASVDRRADTADYFDLDQKTIEEVKAELISRISPSGSSSLVEIHSSILHYEIGFFLSSLLHVEDRTSMASGLEVRVPLLSTAMLEFILPLSLSDRVSGSRPKDLLRTAANPFLPAEITERGDKMGFPVPLREWSNNGLYGGPIRDLLSSAVDIGRPFLKTELLGSSIRKAGLGNRGLWALISLETWFQNTKLSL